MLDCFFPLSFCLLIKRHWTWLNVAMLCISLAKGDNTGRSSCLYENGYEFVFSVRTVHLFTDGEGPVFLSFFWSKAPKGLLNSSPLLFIQWASQTQIVFVQSSRHCHVVFTKGYATMCSVCRMTTKAWSVIYARVTCFFLISLMISSDINFNKFLRIRWCMLISAWEWGRISAAWTSLFIKESTLPCGSNSTTWGLHLNTFTTTGSYHWSH